MTKTKSHSRTSAFTPKAVNDPFEWFALNVVPDNTWCYHIRVPLQWNERTDHETTLTHEMYVYDWLYGALRDNLVHAVYQKEKGGGGTEHWQITIFLTDYVKIRDMRKQLDLPDYKNGLAYIKFAESPKAALLYVSKQDTRVAGPYWCYRRNTHNLPANP